MSLHPRTSMTKNTSSQTERPRKRVFIVDDHPIFREGLVGVIRQQTNLTVCGEADNASQALDDIRHLKPDLLLTDLSLNGKSGLDLLRELRASHLDLPALVISMHDETQYAEQVLRAGGQGYIMKQAGPEKVLAAIATVLGGHVYLSEDLSAGLPREAESLRTERRNFTDGETAAPGIQSVRPHLGGEGGSQDCGKPACEPQDRE